MGSKPLQSSKNGAIECVVVTYLFKIVDDSHLVRMGVVDLSVVGDNMFRVRMAVRVAEV